MFKRPSYRPHGCHRDARPVPYGATGIVAALVRQSDPLPPPPKMWCPPLDVEAYFDMLRKRGEDTSAYERLAAEFPWPEKAPRKGKASNLDLKPLEELFDAADEMPKLSEYYRALRECGYSEAKVAAIEAHFARLEATSDERQKALDLIFARWPSAGKPVKKVIKAVKKKMVR
jgi:hypothetical protein